MRVAVAPTDAGIEAWLNEGLNLERHPDGREFKLDRLKRVMPHLPRPPAPCTVTGTKGKGSTVRLIEMGLRAAGRATLAFTSPHLRRIGERWRRDGVPLEPAAIVAAIAVVVAAEEAAGTRLTYFERCFAIAVVTASERPGTAFICEVGLGGRLDCANVLDAAVVVCTHLSLDHCNLLGPTVAHIAREKLALCRPHGHLVVAPQSPAGVAAVAGVALPQGVSVHRVALPAQPFALALLGEHQQANAATALTALRVLAPDLDEATIRRGFAGATLGGRCQLIEHGGRRILIDGAHNEVSFAATMAVAQRCLRPGWHLVLGLARDKEAEAMLGALPPGVAVRRCGYDSPRARDATAWPTPALAWPFHARIGEALAALPGDADLCITGSFYLAGEALAALGDPAPIPG